MMGRIDQQHIFSANFEKKLKKNAKTKIHGSRVDFSVHSSASMKWSPSLVLVLLPFTLVVFFGLHSFSHYTSSLTKRVSSWAHSLAAADRLTTAERAWKTILQHDEAASQASCIRGTLDGNVIRTKRQLAEGRFTHVVIVPTTAAVWREIESGGHPLDPRFEPSTSPFPVVLCVTMDGLEDKPESFFTSDMDGPPCVRPATGREAGAYASFIAQNYDHLPETMFFIHGHQTRWGDCCVAQIQLLMMWCFTTTYHAAGTRTAT